MNCRLKITLKSDLCAASGDGFSSVIDTDVCSNRNGFPFIPARRLKGCLLEAAKLIGVDADTVDAVFGVKGTSSGCLMISDAMPQDIDVLTAKAERSGIKADEMTEMYTYVRASTAIDHKSGSAQDNSLRFMRAVKRYDPFSPEKEMCFIAPLEIDEKYFGDMHKISRALRNIGYKRNRGFGAVSCELVENSALVSDIPVYSFSPDKDYVVRYTIQLDSNVMVSTSADSTADHIAGTAVQGFFAAEYLKDKPADSEFEEIFLKGGASFSNLYISDEKGSEYFPVPVFAGRVKSTDGDDNKVKRIVNMIAADGSAEYSDKIIKPIKTGYTDFSLNIKKPLTETVYHISGCQKENSQLYTQTALCAGQYFSGTISGSGRALEKLYPILRNGVLRIGRSKTAQYAKCRVVPELVSTAPYETAEVTVKQGQRFALMLKSDMAALDGMGGYISDEASLLELLSQQLGITLTSDMVDSGMKRGCSAIKYRTICGFNTQWGLQRPQFRAIAAGTSLVFTADRDITLPAEFSCGERCAEGFGRVAVVLPETFAYIEKDQRTDVQIVTEDIFSMHRMLEEVRRKAIADFNSIAERKSIRNNSEIGRLILIAKQADSYKALRRGLISIYGDDCCPATITCLTAEEMDAYWREYTLLVLTLLKYRLKADAQRKENK